MADRMAAIGSAGPGRPAAAPTDRRASGIVLDAEL
jgi:hypothetical protein